MKESKGIVIVLSIIVLIVSMLLVLGGCDCVISWCKDENKNADNEVIFVESVGITESEFIFNSNNATYDVLRGVMRVAVQNS